MADEMKGKGDSMGMNKKPVNFKGDVHSNKGEVLKQVKGKSSK